MNIATKRLAGVAAVVSAAALGLTLAPSAAAAGNGTAVLSSLPKDTGWVMNINVDRAKGSPLFKEALAMARKSPELAAAMDMLKAQASFDVTKDVKTITIGLDADFQTNEKGVVLVEGSFDAKKLLAFAKASGTKAVAGKHMGVSFYTIEEAEIAVIKGVMVVAPKGGMKSIIEVHKGKAPNVKANGEFMKMLKSADTSKDFWMVAILPKSLRTQLGAQLGGNGFDSMTASVDVKKGLITKLRLATATAAAAQSIANLMKMGIAQSAGDPSLKALGLAGVLQNVTVSATANNVDVGVTLSDAELSKIKNLIKGFM
ncbi:MAG TPA: hypothetical protein VML75_00120 [Kofleriaceae bacterium]|nr:hypothetical protein [Kofleriaceae bacterium]